MSILFEETNKITLKMIEKTYQENVKGIYPPNLGKYGDLFIGELSSYSWSTLPPALSWEGFNYLSQPRYIGGTLTYVYDKINGVKQERIHHAPHRKTLVKEWVRLLAIGSHNIVATCDGCHWTFQCPIEYLHHTCEGA